MTDPNEAIPATGRCLCGRAAFSAKVASREFHACHCTYCRQWSGGVFLGTELQGAPDLDDPEAVTYYGSSDWGERGFCKFCGSSLFWRMRDGSHWIVSIQALDDLPDAKFAGQLFIDEKPATYSFAENTHTMTGAEFAAMFASQSE